MKYYKWKETIMDLLYPPRCPICHDIVEPGYKMICGSCLKQLPLVSLPKCEKCGKPVPEGEKLCYDCTVIQHDFTEGIGVFLYNDVMRKSMYKFKYQGCREYGAFYAAAAWLYGKEKMMKWKPQVIVPIPIHISRKRKRGYNQAEIIADGLGVYLQIPVMKNALVRSSKTAAQKELSVEERRINLQNAFSVTGIEFPWKRILLVDDIYTTGSTMDFAAKELKKYRIEEIYSLSICIGKGFVLQ